MINDIIIIKFKRCCICNNSYTYENYNINKTKVDGIDDRCKTCFKEEKRKGFKSTHAREINQELCDLNCEDWQGGKHIGRVYKSTGRTSWTARVNDLSKNFNPKNYHYSDDLTYEAAELWKIKMSDQLRLTKNKYKIIKIKDIPTYIIVQITQGYVTLLDFDLINFVNENTLSAAKSGRDNIKFYAEYYNLTDKSKFGPLHKFILNCTTVIHLSGYLLDNRRSNLRSPNDNTEEPDKQTLKLEYEEIMAQYANEFKWNDNNYDENAIKSEILANSGIKLNRGLMTYHKKEEIYQKYITKINPNYQGIPDLLSKPGERINLITDGNYTFKYCPLSGYQGYSGCDNWKQITEFFNDKETWDGYSRICKNCKQQTINNK